MTISDMIPIIEKISPTHGTPACSLAVSSVPWLSRGGSVM